MDKEFNKLLNTLLIMVLAVIVLVAFARPGNCAEAPEIIEIDGEIYVEITPAVQERCAAKGDVTVFTYRHRDFISEERMLEILQQNWDDTWSKSPNIKEHTYVDMQRIVRDAYRTKRDGSYRRECCTDEAEAEYAIRELEACYSELQY